MASIYSIPDERVDHSLSALADPALAIGSPRLDALCFWGAPAISLIFAMVWIAGASMLPAPFGSQFGNALVFMVGILTYAHLIAVAPRAYLNKEVFAANRFRLTVIPVLLIALLSLSQTALICGLVLAVFWDVHHSALQTFGLSRIYDMKAGNDPRRLRRVDLLLNWALYVAPIGFGAALAVHLHALDRFDTLGWSLLTQVPASAEGVAGWIRIATVGAWLAVVGTAILQYRNAMRRGYRMPVHKAALLGSTALVSVLAWGFTPPFVALVAINLFHAVQYFALVWLKEGDRMKARLAPRAKSAVPAAVIFILFCAMFGFAYNAALASGSLITPFLACSLLHFWYDGFVWSVRKKQV